MLGGAPATLAGDDLVDFVQLRNNPLLHGRASVRFGLASADRVEIRIYDVGGRLVRTLADRSFPAGTHELTWDGLDDHGRRVARGIYFYQLRTPSFVSQKKLAVLKN